MDLTKHDSPYPLTLPALAAGLALAVVIAVLVSSALAGFSVFVFFAVIGGTWRRDEAPIIPFVLAFQWIAVAVGYFYSLATGVFPSVYAPGDLDATVLLSLLGLLLLAAGIRLVRWSPAHDATPDEAMEVANLSGLFWLVMIVYGADYLFVINTKAFASVDVILGRLLDFRQVLLMVLWFEVLRRRTHLRYLWITLGWVFLPLLGSYFSDFKLPLLLLFIVYLCSWTPWEREWWRFSARQACRTTAVIALLIFFALIWQAGVKKQTRAAYDADIVGKDRYDRVALFVESAAASLPVVFNDTQMVVEGLVERISYVTFFSRVLQWVPRVQPHTNGELLRMAVTNTVMPRFLFPNKPALPSDSVYTRRFTGIWIPEEGTSISIGYMAEFYVDWGKRGMMLMIFLYGCWIGLAARAVTALVRPRIFMNPALIVVLMTVCSFEQQFIKAFAALNVAVIVTLTFLFVVRRPLTAFLRLTPVADPDALEPESSPS